MYKRQLFGVDREEWEKSPQFHEKVMERQEHQQEREQAFLAQNRDCFAIYQVSRDDPQNVRFMKLDWLKSHNISIDRSKMWIRDSHVGIVIGTDGSRVYTVEGNSGRANERGQRDWV